MQGTGTVPIGARDDAATATATYREGAAKALADAQTKASFLAGKAGVTITAVQSLAEDGGYIECSSPTVEYAEYEGQQPDFGYASVPSVVGVAGAAAPAAAAAPGKRVSHRPKVKKKHPDRQEGLGDELQPDGAGIGRLRARLRARSGLIRSRRGSRLTASPPQGLGDPARVARASSALEICERAIEIVMWSWKMWAAVVEMPSLKIAKASRCAAG